MGKTTPLFYHQRTEIDPDLQVDEWEVKEILTHKGAGQNLRFLTQWEGADEGDETWEPVGNFVHRYSSEFVKYCKENKLRINLLDFLATQSSVEGVVSSVKRRFRRWPNVKENYAVNREWVEKILLHLQKMILSSTYLQPHKIRGFQCGGRRVGLHQIHLWRICLKNSNG